MTVPAESFASLWAYCSENRRAVPRNWQKLYDLLADKRQTAAGGWEPPLPLILAAWHHTMPLEKHLRFKEHVQWAADHGQLDEIGAYLCGLPEDEWWHFGEL